MFTILYSVVICLCVRFVILMYLQNHTVIFVFAVCRTHPLVLRRFTPHTEISGPTHPPHPPSLHALVCNSYT